MTKKIEKFLHELNALQQEYGLFIVTESEEEILVSLERNANTQNIVCYTADHTINDLDDERAEFDAYVLGRMIDVQ